MEEKDLEQTEITSSEIQDDEFQEEEKKVSFLKAAQGYGMIFGFAAGYIVSGILSEIGIPAGKFECVILCMFAGMAIGTLMNGRKNK